MGRITAICRQVIHYIHHFPRCPGTVRNRYGAGVRDVSDQPSNDNGAHDGHLWNPRHDVNGAMGLCSASMAETSARDFSCWSPILDLLQVREIGVGFLFVFSLKGLQFP